MLLIFLGVIFPAELWLLNMELGLGDNEGVAPCFAAATLPGVCSDRRRAKLRFLVDSAVFAEVAEVRRFAWFMEGVELDEGRKPDGGWGVWKL